MKTKTTTRYDVMAVRAKTEEPIGDAKDLKSARQMVQQWCEGRKGRRPRFVARLTRTVVKTEYVDINAPTNGIS